MQLAESDGAGITDKGRTVSAMCRLTDNFRSDIVKRRFQGTIRVDRSFAGINARLSSAEQVRTH